MPAILVVAHNTDIGEQLLARAGRHAAGIDAKLIVLSAVNEADYTQALQGTASKPLDDIDSVDEVREKGRAEADALADRALEGIDVETDIVCELLQMPRGIVEFAEERDCEQIYIVGGHRTPAGKALFGDLAQHVILNFSGPVTVQLE